MNRLIYTIILVLSISAYLLPYIEKDSTLESGILSFKLGYYPNQTWAVIEHEGFTVSISNNDFNSFLNWGYSFSLYKNFNNRGDPNTLILAGVGIAHKTEVFNRTVLLRLITGFSTPNFPAFSNLLEVEYIFKFYGTNVNLCLSTGVVLFKVLMPISLSLGLSI